MLETKLSISELYYDIILYNINTLLYDLIRRRNLNGAIPCVRRLLVCCLMYYRCYINNMFSNLQGYHHVDIVTQLLHCIFQFTALKLDYSQFQIVVEFR